jgi:hypothetical protein
MHRSTAAIGNAFQQHFIRGRLGSVDSLAGCGVDGDDVLHDLAPGVALCRRFVAQIHS